MKKFASCLIFGVGLMALALSGCASTSHAGLEPTEASAPGTDSESAVESAARPSLEFTSAVSPVLESFPNDYAFFYFDNHLRPVIGFTNKAVPAVIDSVNATGQQAQIIEDAGFTDAEYNATAEKLVVGLQATWPEDVPFPMIGARPDLGAGVIGVTRIVEVGSSQIAEDASSDATQSIQEIVIELPFSIQIEIDTLGPGKTAAAGRLAGE